jgi:hypothetical protein
MTRPPCHRLLAAAGVSACVLTAHSAFAQELVRQPKGDFLVIDIQSLRDDVTLYPGPLEDPPYVYRGWTRAQRAELVESSSFSVLRVWDRALLLGGSRIESQDWEIEFMPTCPTAFAIRTRGGRGRFDLSGMPVESIDAVSQQTQLEFDFKQPNPIQLRSFSAAVHDGSLRWRGFLNAKPMQVALRIPHSRAYLELTGAPFTGEVDVLVYGAEGALEIEVPRGIGLSFTGNAASLEPLRGVDRVVSAGNGLRTRGYDQTGCHVRMHFAQPLDNFKLIWEGDVPAPAPVPIAAVTPASDPETEEQFSNRLLTFLGRLERGELDAAAAQLDELRSLKPDDGRVLFLETWLRENPELNMTVVPAETEAERRLQSGLDEYLLGRYDAALREFRAAERLDPELGYAQAWIRRTRSEISRLERRSAVAETLATEPEVVERVVVRSIAPVFAIRSPFALNVEVRADAIELAGRVHDDVGIERVEVSLNGSPLRDASGLPLQMRPNAHADSARLFEFATLVPLNEGENQIVVTAWDVDSNTHFTTETFAIIRKPPLYRTGAFGLSLGGVGLLGLGFVVAQKLAKYRIAIVNRYNPYIAGLPIRSPEMFFGREKLVNNILNTVHSNSIMLYGPRRIGKTSLQYEIKRSLEAGRDPEFDFLPVMIDLQGTSEERFFAALMTEILDASRGRFLKDPPQVEGLDESYGARAFSRDLRRLLERLQSMSRKKLKLVLLLDEVDELNNYSEKTNQKLRSVFMKTFAEKVVAIMSGTGIKKEWESEGSPWYNFFDEIEVGEFEPVYARRLIRQPVKGMFNYDPDAVEAILRYSHLRPYLIQRFCVHVINYVIDQKRRTVRLADVEAVRAQALKVEVGGVT